MWCRLNLEELVELDHPLRAVKQTDRVNDFETLLVMKPQPAARGSWAPSLAG